MRSCAHVLRKTVEGEQPLDEVGPGVHEGLVLLVVVELVEQDEQLAAEELGHRRGEVWMGARPRRPSWRVPIGL